MKNKFPESALNITATLGAAGYKAHFVGGCVRDFLRGVEPHDYDICTDATPDNIHRAFDNLEHFRAIDTGAKYGTVTVVHDGDAYEVTTYRTDGAYSDGRRPDDVTFASTIAEDLSRRDFTINAMAIDPVSMTVIDPYGGSADLEGGVIRCVGNPYERFTEDGLRILRALRFSATLGFSIEERTSEAIHALRGLTASVSRERVRDELCKIMVGGGPAIRRVIESYADVFVTIIPPLIPMLAYAQDNENHAFDLWEHTARAVEAMYRLGDRVSTSMGMEKSRIILGMALLLHDSGKPSCRTFDKGSGQAHYYRHAKVGRDIAYSVTENLRFDNTTRDAICKLVLHHDSEIIMASAPMRRWLNRLGPDLFQLLICMKSADKMGQRILTFQEERDCMDCRPFDLLQKALEEKQVFSMSQLAVGGRDIMEACGIPEGKEVGRVKKALLDMVIDGKAANGREELLAKAIEIAKEGS